MRKMSKNNSKNNLKKIIGSILAAIALLIGSALGIDFSGEFQSSDNGGDRSAGSNIVIEGQANTEVEIRYSFRTDKLLADHYDKHGKEMGFDSAEEYLTAANVAIQNPDVLHKLESEDGDDVYFVEDTGEFVVVSTDGYIRTYYYADLDYFNRQ